VQVDKRETGLGRGVCAAALRNCCAARLLTKARLILMEGIMDELIGIETQIICTCRENPAYNPLSIEHSKQTFSDQSDARLPSECAAISREGRVDLRLGCADRLLRLEHTVGPAASTPNVVFSVTSQGRGQARRLASGGSTIDFVADGLRSSFRFDNPTSPKSAAVVSLPSAEA
jgi:hypothetical protein